MASFKADYASYTGDYKDQVDDAIRLANTLVTSRRFLDAIANKSNPDSFDKLYTSKDATPKAVAKIIENSNSEMKVHLEIHHDDDVLGWTYKRNYYNLWLNITHLDRPVNEMSASLIHELIHSLDGQSDLEFGHGENDSTGKGQTAPYWIGNTAYKMLSADSGGEKMREDFDALEYNGARFREMTSPDELGEAGDSSD